MEHKRSARVRVNYHRIGLALAGTCAFLAFAAFASWLTMTNDPAIELAALTAALFALGPLCYLAVHVLGRWLGSA